MNDKYMIFTSKLEAEKLTNLSDKIIELIVKENLSYLEAVTVLEITQERLKDAIVSEFGDRSMKTLTATSKNDFGLGDVSVCLNKLDNENIQAAVSIIRTDNF